MASRKTPTAMRTKDYTPVAQWTPEKVVIWLNKVGLSELGDKFLAELVDGAALKDLTDSDMKDLGLSLGTKKKLQREIQALLQQDKFGSRYKGVTLPKGYLPKGDRLDAAQKKKICFNRFDSETLQWVPRDDALSVDELQCWDDQAEWLQCPITGLRWFDAKAVLGVGLRHEPRFISAAEHRRALEDEEMATNERNGLRGAGDGGGLNRSLSSLSRTSSGGSTDGGGARGGGIAGQGDDYEKEFQVYPHVDPPPPQNIDSNLVIEDDVACGNIEVLVGPCFDIHAFNDGAGGNEEKGILSMSDRGSLSLDQQYNGVNFMYYIERAQNSYVRSFVTNRLSFYIEDVHGLRVFPKNIRSQLSLLMYHDANRLVLPNGETNEPLLAVAVRKCIPRILRAVVQEVVNGRSSALECRIDHAIRTYLLIHQVSIKLVVYYKGVLDALSSAVFTWLANPFTPAACKLWPSLEELLIVSSLVGLPWDLLREAFMRKLFLDLRVACNVAAETPARAALRHIWRMQKPAILRILYLHSFFLSGRSPAELDRVYSRCAGTLPRAERQDMKDNIRAVESVQTLEQVWVLLGMESPESDVEEVTASMANFFNMLSRNAAKWALEEQVVAPSINLKAAGRNAPGGPARIQAMQDAQNRLVREQAKHRGYPKLVKGQLSRTQCLYPDCGRKFVHREQLMRHLKRMIPGPRMIRNYHKAHFQASFNIGDLKHIVQNLQPNQQPVCPVGTCQQLFPSVRAMVQHLFDFRSLREKPAHVMEHLGSLIRDAGHADVAEGAPEAIPEQQMPLPSDDEQHDDDAADAAAAPGGAVGGGGGGGDDDSCVVCMDAKRAVVLSPCGHICMCVACAGMQKRCPVCMTDVRDVIRVFYS